MRVRGWDTHLNCLTSVHLRISVKSLVHLTCLTSVQVNVLSQCATNCFLACNDWLYLKTHPHTPLHDHTHDHTHPHLHTPHIFVYVYRATRKFILVRNNDLHFKCMYRTVIAIGIQNYGFRNVPKKNRPLLYHF